MTATATGNRGVTALAPTAAMLGCCSSSPNTTTPGLAMQLCTKAAAARPRVVFARARNPCSAACWLPSIVANDAALGHSTRPSLQVNYAARSAPHTQQQTPKKIPSPRPQTG